MDFENLTLEQVIDLQQLGRLADYLLSCNVALELYDHHGQVIMPRPTTCTFCDQTPPGEDCGTDVDQDEPQPLWDRVIEKSRPEVILFQGNHVAVGVPIRPFSTTLGVLTACHTSPQTPTTKTEPNLDHHTADLQSVGASLTGLLTTILDQATTVTTQKLEIDNLAQELLDRYEQLNFFFDLARHVSPAEGLHRMLDCITAKIAQQFGPNHIIAIFHQDKIDHLSSQKAYQAGVSATVKAHAQQLCQHIASQVFESKQTVTQNNLHLQQELEPLTSTFTAVLSTPILVDNQCYGTLNALRQNRENPFFNGDIALIESVGKQVGIFIENQQLYQRLEEMHQSHKMEALGRLAGGIAHDFNNILSSIIGYSEMVRDDLPDDNLSRANLERVLKAGYRAKDLVQQILTFSRRREQSRRQIRAVSIVEEVLELLRASLPTTIELRQHLDSVCGVISVDPTQLHQVVMNLCTNASQAMREQGGILEVSLAEIQVHSDTTAYKGTAPGTYVRLTVRDTGCGMTPEVMRHIFDPFFTAETSGKGTGMGLAIVHGIVTSHDGTITVSSEPGQGTTFHVLFPKVADVVEDEAPGRALSSIGNERILLVDDEEDLVDMSRQMLERLGYDIVATTRSAKALEAFRAHPSLFDVVITDYKMPDLTGDQLAREMLSIRPDIPIILVTGFSQSIGPEQAREIGFREYVRKPVNVRDLGEAVRRVLTKKG